MARGTVLLLTALLAGACSSGGPDVPASTFPLEADQASLEKLEGRWEGQYHNETAGRTGSIVLDFTTGELHGHGDVLMIPEGSKEPLQPAPPPAGGDPPRQMPRFLTIRFARAERGTLSGELDPYIDPDCVCEVTANFTGTITGDVLQGRFTASGPQPGVAASQGTWKVKKVARRAQ